MTSDRPSSEPAGKVLSPDAGETLALGGLGVVFKVQGTDTGGAFAVVEHPLAPGTLAAPLHTHSREDEVSFVLEGEIGVRFGDRELQAGPGAYIVKPRGIPHTFWNAGSQPARLLEIISPAGLQHYFRELAEIVNLPGEPDFGALLALAARYGLDMHLDSISEISEQHGVQLGGR